MDEKWHFRQNIYCALLSLNMLVAQYETSADITSNLTLQWNKSTVK